MQIYPTVLLYCTCLWICDVEYVCSWVVSNTKRNNNKKFSEELITYFPLIQHEPHRKGHIQQFINCRVCIHCHNNVFTKPLPSNDKGIHIQTLRHGRDLWSMPMRWLRCDDIHTKFHKDWFRHSKVDGILRHTDSMVIIEAHFYFYKLRNVG
jgi:hypothetical protein